jgi:hypothetical protein
VTRARKRFSAAKQQIKKTGDVIRQIQSPRPAMCDNPFIVHEFFCARGKGTRRHRAPEQTRIANAGARKSRNRRTIRLFRGVVTIMQQIDCNPQFGLLAVKKTRRGVVYRKRAPELFLFQFGDLVR